MLTVGFHGNLTGAPYTGMYLAYTNSTGQRVNMASTQFSPTDARRAFPCFDEPAIKARFVITIHNSERYPTVLSNMRPSSTSPSPARPGWLMTEYPQTVVMSSYLVGMVVCDFVYTERSSQCGSATIPSRVYAPAHRLNDTLIPARMAADIISYYCTYFDMEYPMPKEDHIGIPQMKFGAMENVSRSHPHSLRFLRASH